MLLLVLLFLWASAHIFARPNVVQQNYRIGVPRFNAFDRGQYEVYLGDKVRLSCLAHASPSPIVHWFRNGNLITEAQFRTGHFKENKNDMSLEIKKVEVSDQGLWSCKVFNSIGFISRNFTVEIADFCDYFFTYGMPQSSIPLECMCLWKRQGLIRPDLDFSIATEQNCLKYKTSLQRHQKRPMKKYPCYEPPCDDFGRPIKRMTGRKVHEHVPKIDEMDDQEDDLAVLVEPGPGRYSENNKYNTYFKNFSAATKIEKAVLSTSPPTTTAAPVRPSFAPGDEQDRSIASPAGRTIRLNCKVTGNPEPIITWRKDKDNKTLLLHGDARPSGSEYKIRKYSLEMEDTTESDSGTYSCEAWNGLGTVMKYFNVTVVNRMRSPPLIVPNVLHNQTAYVNGSAQFQCRVVSDLIPHIMWVKIVKAEDGMFYYNKTAKEMMFKYIEMDTVHNARIVKNKDESTLYLENLSIADNGLYACITGNSLGTTIANATLIVNDFYPLEIPTGRLETEYSFTNIFLVVIISIMVSILIGLFLSYFTCFKYVRRKRQEDRAALLIKRKKIVVHKSIREEDAWSDLPSSYKITVEQGSSIVKKGRRPRLSSDMTLLDDYEVDTDPRWEIDRRRLELLEEIGSGAFGEVCKARLHPDKRFKEQEVLPVAVKKVKQCATEKDLVALVGEMEMFKTIGNHENVLRLVGCCTGVGPLYVILELCEYGNLRDFLRAHRPKDERSNQPPKENGPIDYLAPRKSSASLVLIENLTQRHLVEFAWQVAKGMAYMASKKIVHRDLAARNVLVAKNFVMKISDFGLSRDVHYRDYYRKRGRERIPYKWMAIESLDENQISTIESDVWSFGILLWEIMTLGGTPYPTIAMQQLYNCLKAGYRMEAPHNCPEEIYRLMTACWQERREKRPSFMTIVDFLEWMLSEGETVESDDYSPRSGGSSDDLDREDGRSSPPSEEEQSSAKRRHRPLSAPVNLPSDPQHDICDEDDLDDDLPEREAPTLGETDSLLQPEMDMNHMPIYSIPHKLFRQHTDPSSDTIEAFQLEQRHISSIVAPSIDSAIGSPAWHLMDSQYSIPMDQTKSTHFYVNVGSTDSFSRTKFPFPPNMTRFSQGSLHENPTASLLNGKTNQAYMPSPNAYSVDREDLCRRQSGGSSSSSGRGRTESEEKIVHVSDYSSITNSHLPLRRLGDRKKSDDEQRRNAVGSLMQKLSGNL